MDAEPSRGAREQQGGGRETVAQMGPPTALRVESCDVGGGRNQHQQRDTSER
jgi:hypothetical protein